MSDPVIPSVAFGLIDDELRCRIRDSKCPALDVDDPGCGEAFSRVILFERYPDLVERVAPGLPPCDRFYNHYYWAQRLTGQLEAKHGYDAGNEQWVFKVLESAHELQLDWPMLEALERRARS